MWRTTYLSPSIVDVGAPEPRRLMFPFSTFAPELLTLWCDHSLLKATRLTHAAFRKDVQTIHSPSTSWPVFAHKQMHPNRGLQCKINALDHDERADRSWAQS